MWIGVEASIMPSESSPNIRNGLMHTSALLRRMACYKLRYHPAVSRTKRLDASARAVELWRDSTLALSKTNEAPEDIGTL